METHKQLTHYDRERIASLLLLDFKPAQIAKRLGRHRSVITREIRNNQYREVHRPYPPCLISKDFLSVRGVTHAAPQSCPMP